jgi:hypothetical protein
VREASDALLSVDMGGINDWINDNPAVSAAVVAAIVTVALNLLSGWRDKRFKRQEWAKEQRREAYGTFLTATHDYLDAIWATHSAAAKADPLVKKASSEAEGAAFRRARAVVQVLGPKTVFDAAESIHASLRQYEGWLKQDDTWQVQTQQYQQLDAFAVAAQEALGI